ncbi:MFS transporter [Glutamicibacter sp. NPDC087344]|uniref:MFS transporter n=1 Tax=Glutamicibacter sp. NPDC087344 TaxID=3363994 RepID=UPI0037FD9F04
MATQIKSKLRAPFGVGMMFASNGAIFAALLPWYPLVAERLGLSSIEFGFIVASFAVGALLSSALPAPLIARFGAIKVAIAGTLLLALAIAGAAWAGTGWAFALCIFLAGFFDAIVDVAQNVAGIRVQDTVQRSILSSMHALWSLGALLSGLLATAVAASGFMDMRSYLALVAVTCVVLVTAGGLLVGQSASRQDLETKNNAGSHSRRQLFRLVFLASLPLIVIAICGTVVEDIANNWAAMAGVQIGGLTPQTAGVVYSVMVGSQCVGRFTGDLLIQRYGSSLVARLGGLLTATGGILVVATTGNTLLLFLGLALAGYGSATLVPSALSAAAKIPGVTEGAGVTLVSWLMRVGFLATSPIIGTVTNSIGLRWGLGALMIVGVATFLLAPSLRTAGEPIAADTESLT